MIRYKFVENIPDLIHPEEYSSDPQGRRMRFRIRATAEGIEILGDAVRPKALEQLLGHLGEVEIEQMLCG